MAKKAQIIGGPLIIGGRKLSLSRAVRAGDFVFLTGQVPFEDGASVLDALIWIRSHRDSSLAVRYSCINANACKECMMLVDGRVEYACTARLKDGTVTVEPLANKALVRDLVTDVVPPKETLARVLAAAKKA